MKAVYLITCKLFCQEQEIDGELEFLILASDGLWDVVPNEVSLTYTKFDTHACFAFFLWAYVYQE